MEGNDISIREDLMQIVGHYYDVFIQEIKGSGLFCHIVFLAS